MGPFLLPLHEDCLVDRIENLLRVPLVDLNGLLGSVVLVTVNVILLSCHLLGLPPSLVHQVTSQTSVTIKNLKVGLFAEVGHLAGVGLLVEVVLFSEVGLLAEPIFKKLNFKTHFQETHFKKPIFKKPIFKKPISRHPFLKNPFLKKPFSRNPFSRNSFSRNTFQETHFKKPHFQETHF